MDKELIYSLKDKIFKKTAEYKLSLKYENEKTITILNQLTIIIINNF